MPTFDDPLVDAAEAAEALRGLAHASRVFDDPADTCRVIGEIVSGVRSLRQVLDQIAAIHLRYQNGVSTDNGDWAAGAQAALAAAVGFQQAAALVDQADDRISAAFSQSGRIVWHPQRPVVERWVGVVFLQGDEAAEVLDRIDQDGPDAAIDYLAGWDYGDETTGAALVNGDLHDTPPAYPGDRRAEAGDYVLTYNPHAGHAALYRRHEIPAEDVVGAVGEEPTARRDRGGAGQVRPAPGPSAADVSGSFGASGRVPDPRLGGLGL